MSVVQETGWCHTCQQQRLFEKPRINHVLHLILSAVTLGAWLFVWAFLGLVNSLREPRCHFCGTELGHAPAAAAPQPLRIPPPFDHARGPEAP